MSTEEPEHIEVMRTDDEFIYDQHRKRYIDFKLVSSRIYLSNRS
jgi:hypothetical protein